MKYLLLRENYQKAKKILKEEEIDINDTEFNNIKNLLGKHTGYLGKFTEWYFKQHTNITYLRNLLNQILEVGLDKSIDTFETAESLGDYLTKTMYDRKTKQVLKSLPSRARRLVTDKLIDLIFNFPQYIVNIKDFYSKKGGRYKTNDKLYNDTESLINNLSGGWSVESIKYNEEELVYKDITTLILHISDYSRSCDLGSQHWCISTDESMWDGYTSDFKKQYFIYDFSKSPSDKKSMIGVTIDLSGSISACHYKDDSEGDKKEILNEYGQYLIPYSKEYIKSKIDIDDITEVSKYGIIEEVKRLIQQKVDPTINNNKPIRWSSEYGHLDVVRELLKDPRVNPSVKDNSAIRLSSDKGHVEVVRELLKDPRVDPRVFNNLPIITSSMSGHVEVVKLLLKDPRVDPSADNNYAIRWASRFGQIEVVRELLKDPRVDPSDKNNYAINYASHYGHTDVIKELIKDSRVRSSLSKEDLIKYENQVNI